MAHIDIDLAGTAACVMWSQEGACQPKRAVLSACLLCASAEDEEHRVDDIRLPTTVGAHHR